MHLSTFLFFSCLISYGMLGVRVSSFIESFIDMVKDSNLVPFVEFMLVVMVNISLFT